MTQIGKYDIIEEIGKGGFGVVYKARDLSLERDVALKVLHPQLTVDTHFLERFRKEAKALARVSHPNVVTIYEIGEEAGRIFIAMEYLPGGSLADRLTQGPLPVEAALKIAKDIGSGLSAGHAEGLVHRDVKPGNILFNKHGQAVIADFGLAKAMQVSSTTVATSYGGAVGTPYYRAPELWNGTPPPSPATDIYSLACVVYEMLTGEILFGGDTPSTVMLKHFQPLPDLDQKLDHFPALNGPAIKKALHKEPKERYQSITELITDLTQRQEPQGPEVQAQPKPAVDQSTTRAEPLEEKPNEKHRPAQPTAKTPRGGSKPPADLVAGKKRMPAWLPWLLWGIIGVVLLIVLVRGNGGDDDLVSTATEEPTEVEFVVTDTPQRAPAGLGIGSTMVNSADGALMVYVPEGEFTMGSEEADADSDEAPEHQVWLDAFWIYQTEVTNAQFAAFINATAYQTTAEEVGSSWVYDGSEWNQTTGAFWGLPEGPGSSIDGREDHPVVHISWFDADAYCQWAGGQLLTEAQWEKAARGTDGWKYPWGDEPPACSLANYIGCVGGTSSVGSYPSGASPFGALDMAGNVWEWVADWFDADYYSRSDYENPIGPQDGDMRVVRGGSWFSVEWILRVSNRYGDAPDYSNYLLGFRCLRSP